MLENWSLRRGGRNQKFNCISSLPLSISIGYHGFEFNLELICMGGFFW